MDRPSSPYTPGFGSDPPVLAGRSHVIAHVRAGLAASEDPTAFPLVLEGVRGVGKTVILHHLGALAREAGWLVVHHQAGPDDDLLASINYGAQAHAAKQWRLRNRFRLTETSTSAHAGPVATTATWQRENQAAPQTLMALREPLQRVGQAARRRKTGLMISIDEAQVVPSAQWQRFGAVLQPLTRNEKLPIGVVVAGLPQLSTQLVTVGSTYLERSTVMEIDFLGPSAATQAVADPAGALGVTFQPAALARLLDQAGGYPYFLQLFAHHSWEAWRTTASPQIATSHVTAGLQESATQLDHMFTGRWQRLGPLQQAYLGVVAHGQPEPVATSTLTAALGRTAGQLASTRDSLIQQHGLLRVAGHGLVALTFPPLGAWIRHRHPELAAPSPLLPATNRPTRPRRREIPGPGIEL